MLFVRVPLICCIDDFQQYLQEALSECQSTISSENGLCPGPICIHGIDSENWYFLKFIRKSKFNSFEYEILQNIVSVCQAL